jgi:hypothetical protein
LFADQTVTLKFTLNAASRVLNWHHAGEFEYEGMMYDIVAQRITPDSAIYICWADHAESEINKKIDAMIAGVIGHDPTHQHQQQVFRDFLLRIFYQDNIEISSLSIHHTLRPTWMHKSEHWRFCDPPPSPPPDESAV